MLVGAASLRNWAPALALLSLLAGLALSAAPSPPEQRETSCANARDDDGDFLLDCEDEDCDDDSACQLSPCRADLCQLVRCERSPACVEDHCANQADDDGDFLSDCHDPDCDKATVCALSPRGEARDEKTAGACATKADCPSGECLREQDSGYPGGICTASCGPDGAACPGGACQNGACLASCAETPCRAGYHCFAMNEGRSLCLPDCTRDEDCPETGRCNLYSGFCAPDQGRKRDGERCQDAQECEGGLCLDARCSSLCDPEPASFRFSAGSEPPPACPPGESCHPTGPGLAGICEVHPESEEAPAPWSDAAQPLLSSWGETPLSTGASAAQLLWRDARPRYSLAELESDEASPVFSLEKVHALRLDFAPGARHALKLGDKTWEKARASYDGQDLGEIGVRLKGGAGSGADFSQKPSLSLRFDAHAPGNTLYGLKKLALNNAKQDPSYLSEALSYWLFAQEGIPAPRAAFAEVWADGELFGLYVVVESKDEIFLQSRWGNGPRWLYEGSYGADFDQPDELESHESGGEAALATLARALREEDEIALSQSADLDEFVTVWALEAFTDHWDGYSFQGNNFYATASPEEKRWMLLPHGADQVFQDPNARLDKYPMGAVLGAMLSRGIARPALLREWERWVQDPSREEAFRARVDALSSLIAEAAARDPRAYFSPQERARATLWLRAFWTQRLLSWSLLRLVSPH